MTAVVLAEKVAERWAPEGPFVPNTIKPPKRFLNGVCAARAALCNPIELFDEELFRLPYRDTRRFGRRVVEFMDPALVRTVLVEHADAFVRADVQRRFTEPLIGRGILTARGDHWRLQRKTAAPGFRACAVDALAPAVAAAGANAVEMLTRQSGASVDVMPVMMRATFEVLAEVILGREAYLFDQVALDRAASDYLDTLPLRTAMDAIGQAKLHDALPLKGQRAVRSFRSATARAIARCHATSDNGQTLVGKLALAFDQCRDGGAGENELLDSVVGFLAAGNETAALGLTWALYLIGNDVSIQNALRLEAQAVLGDEPFQAVHLEKLELHVRVLKEALRLYPPLALVMRTATREVPVGPLSLNPGDEAVCAIYVMHRSHLLWDAPHVFDPGRFLPEQSEGRHRMAFLPFGAGPHMCIGMRLAYLEMAGILAQLTRSLSFGPGARPIEPRMHLTLRPKGGMHLSVGRC